MNNDQFYVKVDTYGTYGFYYNMEAIVNEHIEKVLGWYNFTKLEMTKSGYAAYKSNLQRFHGQLPRRGDAEFGVIGSFNEITEELNFQLAKNMLGIVAEVNNKLAIEILELAKFYCPVDTGKLRDSGKIEQGSDGSTIIKFDTPYAWYVHEHYWKTHKFPSRAFFLSYAIEEVYKRHGLPYVQRKIY